MFLRAGRDTTAELSSDNYTKSLSGDTLDCATDQQSKIYIQNTQKSISDIHAGHQSLISRYSGYGFGCISRISKLSVHGLKVTDLTSSSGTIGMCQSGTPHNSTPLSIPDDMSQSQHSITKVTQWLLNDDVNIQRTTQKETEEKRSRTDKTEEKCLTRDHTGEKRPTREQTGVSRLRREQTEQKRSTRDVEHVQRRLQRTQRVRDLTKLIKPHKSRDSQQKARDTLHKSRGPLICLPVVCGRKHQSAETSVYQKVCPSSRTTIPPCNSQAVGDGSVRPCHRNRIKHHRQAGKPFTDDSSYLDHSCICALPVTTAVKSYSLKKRIFSLV